MKVQGGFSSCRHDVFEAQRLERVRIAGFEMNELFENETVKLAFAALLVILVLGLFGWLKFKRDEKVVASFLKDSGVDDRPIHKTTYEISSATNLHEKRVRKVCLKSTRIKQQQDDSWKFHG
jgi:hypothetical protein